MVSGILASMINEFPTGTYAIKDAVTDMMRFLFVAAWIGMLLMQANILKRGLESAQIVDTSNLDSISLEVN